MKKIIVLLLLLSSIALGQQAQDKLELTKYLQLDTAQIPNGSLKGARVFCKASGGVFAKFRDGSVVRLDSAGSGLAGVLDLNSGYLHHGYLAFSPDNPAGELTTFLYNGDTVVGVGLQSPTNLTVQNDSIVWNNITTIDFHNATLDTSHGGGFIGVNIPDSSRASHHADTANVALNASDSVRASHIADSAKHAPPTDTTSLSNRINGKLGIHGKADSTVIADTVKHLPNNLVKGSGDSGYVPMFTANTTLASSGLQQNRIIALNNVITGFGFALPEVMEDGHVDFFLQAGDKYFVGGHDYLVKRYVVPRWGFDTTWRGTDSDTLNILLDTTKVTTSYQNGLKLNKYDSSGTGFLPFHRLSDSTSILRTLIGTKSDTLVVQKKSDTLTWDATKKNLADTANTLRGIIPSKTGVDNMLLDTTKWNTAATRAGNMVNDSTNWNTAYTRSTNLVNDSTKWNAKVDSVQNLAGAGVALYKTGTKNSIKRLKGSGSTTVTDNGDSVTISSTGGGGVDSTKSLLANNYLLYDTSLGIRNGGLLSQGNNTILARNAYLNGSGDWKKYDKDKYSILFFINADESQSGFIVFTAPPSVDGSCSWTNQFNVESDGTTTINGTLVIPSIGSYNDQAPYGTVYVDENGFLKIIQ